jgi:glycerol-1-phosphate dehydrogenase [NAD(P)+]
VPTIISNDGVASPISVLKGPEHDISLPAHTPMGILIDYDVIETSDRYHTLSGIGDIVSNLSAIRDWDLAIEKGKASPNNFARLLSQSAVDTIITRSPDAQNRQFLESFVHAIILCGLAMNISGDSRPCSGAEHLIAHTLHQLQLSRESHGFLVGSITPYTLWLHGVRDATLFRYFIANRFEYNFDRLANIQPDLGGVLETARTIRGERYTILDAFSTDVLLGQYHDFLEFMDAL